MPGLDDDTGKRRCRFGVVGRGQRSEVCTGLAVGFLLHHLMARAERQEHPLVQRRHRVRDRHAGQCRIVGMRRRQARSADRRQRRRIVDVRRHPDSALGEGVAVLLQEAAVADIDRMADEAGFEFRAQPDIAAHGLAVGIVEVVGHGEIAAGVDGGCRLREGLLVGALAIADRGIGRQPVGQIVFEAGGNGIVPLLELRAGIPVAACIGRRRNGGRGRQNADLRTEIARVVVLRKRVQRPTQAIAAIVDRQRAEARARIAIIDRGFAVAADPVEADAPFLVGPEATATVDLHAVIAGAHEHRRQARERNFRRALAENVNAAADAAAGCDAVHQGARTLEQLDPLDELGWHAVR